MLRDSQNGSFSFLLLKDSYFITKLSSIINFTEATTIAIATATAVLLD